MRNSLFILGVFAALVCFERPAAAQNNPWCAYYDLGQGELRIAGSQHLNNVWPL
jgi:hypothetical protein